MVDLTDVLGDVAKGAATGSIVPGIGTAIGAVGGLALSLAPELGTWLFGGTAPKTLADVQTAVTAATGTTDPTAQHAAIEKDPQLAANLRLQLARIAATREAEQRSTDLAGMQASLADLANARQQTQALAATQSLIAYGAPLVSVVVLAAFGLCMWLAFTRPPADASRSIIDQLVGTLGAMAMAVVSYWVGSTAGSAQKTAALASSVPGEVAKQLLPTSTSATHP